MSTARSRSWARSADDGSVDLMAWFIGGLAFMMEPNYSNRAPHSFASCSLVSTCTMTDVLPLILLLLAAAVVVVVIFRMLGLPPIMGYLLVGAALGPHAAGWVPDTEQTRHLE